MSVQKFKPACILAGEVVPADATIIAKHQAPQLFGLGLIDNIADADIKSQAIDKGMGVFGMVNMVPDENGTLRPGRFGLKAQAADLIQMTANAELHEIGVTSYRSRLHGGRIAPGKTDILRTAPLTRSRTTRIRRR